MGKDQQNFKDVYEKQTLAEPKVEPVPRNDFYYLKKQYFKMLEKSKNLFDEAKIYEKMNCMINILLSNPLLLITFIIITATLILPIFLFTMFAIVNVAIAFTGFVIIEVMLLVIGMTVLCCTMFLIFTTIVVTGVTFSLSAYIVYILFSLVKKKLCCK